MPAEPSFVHLRLHTEYALEDGLIRIKALVERAHEMGMAAVAVTDWHNLFGLVKFYKAAVARGIKPIAGADVRIQDPEHRDGFQVATLLIQDRQGYLNLCQLLSRSFLEGRHPCGQPRLQPTWLNRHHEGLIVLLGRDSDVGQAVADGRSDLAEQRLRHWQHLFGDRCYLSLERLGHADQSMMEHGLLSAALATGTAVVANNNVRFLESDDFYAHEARVCITQGRLLDDSRRPRDYVDQQYFKDPASMHALFADLPVVLDNTMAVAERCNLEMVFGQYVLPAFPIPTEQSEDDYLRTVAAQGLTKRLARHGLAPDVSMDDYTARLEHELSVITSMGFSGYFLIVADFIAWARNNGVPVGPGRGSGAGSVVGWALGITDPDPMRYELLFERFLNPERVSMPDFDIDFCVEGRDRVIDYVAQRYGRDQVSQIITYGTMAAKAVVRDCGRVLGFNYGFVDSIAKLIPNRLDINLEAALEEEPELKQRYDKEEDTRSVIDLARSLEGVARNAGKHAGGLVIAPGPLTDFTPLYTEPDGSSILSQFDKNDVEAIGLVKFDFLGLRNLTIINWAVEAINVVRQAKGEALIDLPDLPLDDADTFKLLQAAHTTAVFQLESPGMKDLLRKLKPDTFDDIVAAVALFRPGPLDAGMVDEYIDRKHGRKTVSYPHPLAEPILSATYGVILYQEQVMQIAQDLAGYSLGHADLLRRAMGKKDADEMARQRDGFIQGAVNNGLPESQASAIFALMETFARYGFNKSHSVAYALVAYQTAWLKTHYPAEFMAAVLSADLDKTDKIANLIEDCRAMDLTILPPDINRSDYRFKVEDGAIRYGLGAIKGVGQGAIANLIDARQRLGQFESLAQLVSELDLQKVNRRTLEGLIRAGAADCLHPNRGGLMQSLPDALTGAERVQADRAAGQASLFGMSTDSASEMATLTLPDPATLPTWTTLQRLRAERDALGLYFSGHPMDELREEVSELTTTTLGEVAERLNRHRSSAPEPTGNGYRRQRGVEMTLAGMVAAIRKRPGKGAFVALEDGTGRIEVALFDRLWNAHSHELNDTVVLVIKGRAEIDEFRGGCRLVAEELMDLNTARSRFARGLEIEIGDAHQDLDQDLAAALQPYRNGGQTPVVVRYGNGKAQALLKLGEAWMVSPSAELLAAINGIQGIAQAKLRY